MLENAFKMQFLETDKANIIIYTVVQMLAR